MKEIVFYLGLGTLFTHELDAVANHEWRVLPLLRMLPEDVGMVVFVVAHIPLFAILVAMTARQNASTRTVWRIGVSVFLVAHAVLHFLFRNDPGYEFSTLLSNLLVYGGAALGIVHLLLQLQFRNSAD